MSGTFTRPDCADALMADARIMARINFIEDLALICTGNKAIDLLKLFRATCRLFDYKTGQLYAYTKISLTDANSNTAASTRRKVRESNFVAPSSEPIAPPAMAANIQNHAADGNMLT